jgi:hypothetical protein
MSMNMTRKTAVSLFVGLAAVVAIGLNANGKSLLAAELPPVDCNINDPFLACIALQWGYPTEGLFIWDPH